MRLSRCEIDTTDITSSISITNRDRLFDTWILANGSIFPVNKKLCLVRNTLCRLLSGVLFQTTAQKAMNLKRIQKSANRKQLPLSTVNHFNISTTEPVNHVNIEMTEPEETVDVDNAVAVARPSDWRSHVQPLSAVFHIPVSAVLNLSATSLPARTHFHIINIHQERKLKC